MGKGFRVTMKSFSSEVTGSALILTIKRPGMPKKKILIDFGGYQERGCDILNDKLEFKPTEIDTVIVTHSHFDHIFKLPLLSKYGYMGNIYTSPGASISIPISLKDCVKVMQREAEKSNTPMLYTLKDVEEVCNLFTPTQFNYTKEILPGVKMTLFENGHLYGSSCILLQISYKKNENLNYFITGDFYLSNELFNVNPLPKYLYNLDNLSVVVESTYAGINSSDVEKNFDKHILGAIQKNHFVLIPSIAQERLELILLRLKALQDCSLLDTSIPIYIHSDLGKEYYNKVYKGREFVDFMPSNYKFVTMDDYETVMKSTGHAKILIASSGMADKGNILRYLPSIVSNKNATIIFTCYQGKHTLGSRIKNSNLGDLITVNGEKKSLLCFVRNTNQFSHHIKQDELLEFLSRFSHIDNIFITHGETTKKIILKDLLEKTFPYTKVFVLDRTVGYRVSKDNVSAFETKLPEPQYYKSLPDKKVLKRPVKKKPKK